MTGGWQYTNEAMPENGVTVEVWHSTACLLAYRTGKDWTGIAERRDGRWVPIVPTLLTEPVVNWREYRA